MTKRIKMTSPVLVLAQEVDLFKQYIPGAYHGRSLGVGARRRTRTGTPFRTTDFKSVASTNSARRANRLFTMG